MNLLLSILAIYGLSYFIRNLSGPFNIFGLIRNYLLTNRFVGLFFYKLLDCPWCLGAHCGYLIYIMNCEIFKIVDFFTWLLAGAAIVAILDLAINRLSNNLTIE